MTSQSSLPERETSKFHSIMIWLVALLDVVALVLNFMGSGFARLGIHLRALPNSDDIFPVFGLATYLFSIVLLLSVIPLGVRSLGPNLRSVCLAGIVTYVLFVTGYLVNILSGPM